MDKEAKADAIAQWLLVAAHRGWMNQPDPQEFATQDEWVEAFMAAVQEADRKLPAHDKAAIDHMAERIVEFVLDENIEVEP